MAAAMQELILNSLGSELVAKCNGKPMGLYFSAHWCPPCRGFTPQLAQMYKDGLKDKMEIIFVSSDRDEASFDDYFKEMPWLCLPYEKRTEKEQLSKALKVQGIPTFVVIAADGTIITKDGRSKLQEDPKGENFPAGWLPMTKAQKQQVILDSLGSELVGKSNGKPIGLYFSAHWCPPCRGFTPKLVEMYNDGLKDKMEIIFVSSDRDEVAFKDYFKDMPWLCLPYEKRKEKDQLSKVLDVEGIPTFAVINPDGSVITTDGRSKLGEDPKGESLPAGWLPQPFNDVNGDPSPLNEEQCLIMLGDHTAAIEAVRTVATAHYDKVGKDLEAMSTKYFSGKDGRITEQLRKLTKVEGAKLVLLDIPDDGGYYVCDAEPDAVSVAVIGQFLADVRDKKGRKQLQSA